MEDKIAELEACLPKLWSSQDFAKDLIAAFKKNGKLTPKQEPWVQKLLDRANALKPEGSKVLLSSFKGVVELFEKAAKNLKNPTIVLDFGAEQTVRLTLGKPGSMNPGHVYVRIAPFIGYVGKISPDGAWTMMPQALSFEQKNKLSDLLMDLAKDPAGVAAAHGKLTGKCCFCNSELTDQKSTDVGYGPVCAKHYGLPWGNSPITYGEAVMLEAPTPAQVNAEIDKIEEAEGMGFTGLPALNGKMKNTHGVNFCANPACGAWGPDKVLGGSKIDDWNCKLCGAWWQAEKDGTICPYNSVFAQAHNVTVTSFGAPTQTQQSEPASQSIVAEPETFNPTSEQIAEQENLVKGRPSRVQFDLVPGKAIENLLEAMGAKG